ncbi:hypothetical protein KSX_80710 [Ktedonospora formicarum]|uniref:Translation initiation factor beta propellor-like domain-containing protein n=2 Tax=Ktedonospora formicarum TaxID=2778364 RepID=A0A8J3ICU0_9CHLR|nr:hypothetical protein KSX_80710 [Ktedonospora formicarum]
MCEACDPVSAVSWSPDGTRLAVPLYRGRVSVVNVLDGRELFQYQTAHSIATKDIAWSPDGTRLASLGCSGFSHEQELTYLVTLYNLSDGSTTEIGQGTNYLTSLAWSPDSARLVITGSQTIKLWNGASGHLVDISMAQLGGGSAVAWSPDGQYIATARGKTIHIWEANTERTFSVLQTNAAYGAVECVKWSPDGQSLAAGDADRSVHIWPLESMVPA